MRGIGLRPTTCKRALEWASLRLDGELSDLERRMLDSHLESCASCAAIAGELDAFTEALRATPLLPLERPVSLPERRRIPVRALQVAVAATLVVGAAGLGTLVGTGKQPTVPTKEATRSFQNENPLIALADSSAGLPRYAVDIKHPPPMRPMRRAPASEL
jgi:anti-sigma factor RsiW